jgi:hypothetical protein
VSQDGAFSEDAKMSRQDKRESVVASQPRTTTNDAVQTTSKEREADALEDDEVREALKRLHTRDNSG